MNTESKCPVLGGHTSAGTSHYHQWWPNKLNLKILSQNSEKRDPMGARRLRALRPVLYSDGMAQCRHVSNV